MRNLPSKLRLLLAGRENRKLMLDMGKYSELHRRGQLHVLRLSSNIASSTRAIALDSPIPPPYRRRRSPLIDHPSDDWRDWFTATEYANAWDASENYLHSFEDNETLDVASRHLLQLLHDLYHCGIYQDLNRITTYRVNHLLQRMLDLNVSGMAARGDALLKRMALFDGLVHSPAGRNNTNSNDSADVNPAAVSNSDRRWPVAIPLPNRKTYNLVLQLYSRTPSDTVEVPQRAKQLVHDMHWRYKVLGELDMKPHAYHWNCVVLCWKECSVLTSPVEVAKLLLQLQDSENADSSSSSKDENGDDSTDRTFSKSPPKIVWDESLLVNALRVCGSTNADSDQRKLLGASVAVKLWQELIESAPASDVSTTLDTEEIPVETLPSQFYASFLQAIRHFPLDNPIRTKYFEEGFVKACDRGKLNEIIMKEFVLYCRNAALLQRKLGAYNDGTMGMSINESVTVLMERVPEEWKAHATEVKNNNA